MNITIRIIPKTLHFKQPAGTSRGVYTTRNVWYINIKDNEKGYHGTGECAPLPALSCDDLPDYKKVLENICNKVVSESSKYNSYEEITEKLTSIVGINYPSILFGLETAFRSLISSSYICDKENSGKKESTSGIKLWDTTFSKGESGIPINGLIWMGNFEEMFGRIEEKMKAGFRCIKLKIGAIDFEKELELIKHIRRHFSEKDIELRVDANGAFSPQDAPYKLDALSKYGLHSIEQPIKAGQWNEMAKLCASTPLPIALDEELIGINETSRKTELLETISPQYIILKPSLHGGIHGSEEWIKLAKERGIGSWVTSALESNIGLNAIAQWCATLNPDMPQGLGTGLLFTDNIDYPLNIKGDCLWFDPEQPNPDLESWLEI